MNKIVILFAFLLLPALSCAQQQPGSGVSKLGAPISLAGFPSVSDKVIKTDADWKNELTPEQYDVLRQKGTETPGSGALLHNHDHGVFVCAACGNPLFGSDTKFESGTGWPSFYQPIEKGRVLEVMDEDGSRTEVLCARCGGHLGHVFDDGPKPTGLRYCMNSVAMKFVAFP
jgi:peptide-methionine (R)-S-oxide reductase